MANELKRYVLDGRHFISGLMWEVPDVNSLIKGIVKKNTSQCAFYCLLPIGNQISQVGLVSKEEVRTVQADVGDISLAATLCRIINQPTWVGVFALNATLSALVVVRNGSILSGHDCACEHDEIYTRFLSIMSTLHEAGEQIDKVFCPPSWAISGSEAISAKELLKSSPKKIVGLKRLSGLNLSRKHKGQVKFFAVVGSLLLIVWGGRMGYNSWQQSQLEAIVINTRLLPVPHEWAMRPLVNTQLDEWQLLLEQLPVVLNGWDLTKVKFTTDNISVSYIRNRMLSSDTFANKALSTFGVAPIFTENGDAANLVLPISDKEKNKNDETLLPAKNVNIQFYSYFQHLGIDDISLIQSEVQLPPLPTSNDTHLIYKWRTPDWKKFIWSVQISVPPDALLYGLSPLPGLRIRSMSTENVKTSSWKLEGDFYAKLK